MRAGGIILAAGFSSRLAQRTGGGSKALLPLPGGTFLELAAAGLRAGGVEDIWVVTGHDHAAVAHKALELGLKVVENPIFASGMFSSVCAGLRAALPAPAGEPAAPAKAASIFPAEAAFVSHAEAASIFSAKAASTFPVEAVFILPVDAPLVHPASIAALLEAAQTFPPPQRAAMAFLPLPPHAHGAKADLLRAAGHPPLLGAALARAALNWRRENGLQGYFASLPEHCLEFVSLPDNGIMSDIDTPEEYLRLLAT